MAQRRQTSTSTARNSGTTGAKKASLGSKSSSASNAKGAKASGRSASANKNMSSGTKSMAGKTSSSQQKNSTAGRSAGERSPKSAQSREQEWGGRTRPEYSQQSAMNRPARNSSSREWEESQNRRPSPSRSQGGQDRLRQGRGQDDQDADFYGREEPYRYQDEQRGFQTYGGRRNDEYRDRQDDRFNQRGVRDTSRENLAADEDEESYGFDEEQPRRSGYRMNQREDYAEPAQYEDEYFEDEDQGTPQRTNNRFRR